MENNNEKKTYVDQDYIIRREKYNRKSDDKKKEEKQKEKVTAKKTKERKENIIYIIFIIIMIIIYIVTLFLTLKKDKEKDVAKEFKNSVSQIKVDKVLEAKRTMPSEKYNIEKEIISLRKEMADGGDEADKIQEKKARENDLAKRLSEIPSISQEDNNTINNNTVDYVTEEFKIFLDSDLKCMYTEYIFDTSNNEVYEKEKAKLKTDNDGKKILANRRVEGSKLSYVISTNEYNNMDAPKIIEKIMQDVIVDKYIFKLKDVSSEDTNTLEKDI